VIGVNGNATRIRHRTNTLPGSSGSPCFDQDWTPVALHRGRDPNFHTVAPTPPYNVAVPLGAILAELRRHGLEHFVGLR
jgi:hypothetical protein